MHRSRVYAVLIDTPEADAARATAFWSGALGVAPRLDPSETQFIELPEGIPGVVTAIQAHSLTTTGPGRDRDRQVNPCPTRTWPYGTMGRS